MPVLLFVLFSVLLVILVSGGYMFFVACVRRKEMPWLIEEEMQKTPYSKYIQYIQLADRFFREHDTQEVSIESFDGLKLCGLWVRAKEPKGTILLAHGYRSSKLLDFSVAFEYYHDLGMNLLVPDQRAHGKSEGKYITFGVKESRDMVSWIDFHNQTYGNFPVILSGLSMGASTMLYLADRELPPNVKGIIADCGFTSPKAILGSVFRSVIHMPAGPTLLAAEWFARIFAGFSLTEKDTRVVLKNSRLPVFMVHGTDDNFVPCEMTREGYAVCTGEKSLLLVDGAEHGVSFLVDRPAYTDAIMKFLDKNIGGLHELRGD